MATSRSALGRGLGALLPSSPAKPTALSEPMQREGEAPASLGSPDGSALRSIPVSEIDPNPEQPRRHFNPEHLEELANSVSRHGVLQPVVVRRAGNRYELIVGERRWRASRAAGLETIPAVISDAGPRAKRRFLEFFTAHIRNPNTRAAYARAVGQSLLWCEERG